MRTLDAYLALERVMLELDRAGDPVADDVRDVMEPIWYRLTDEEIAALDSRGQIDPNGLFPIRLPVPVNTSVPPPTIVLKTFSNPIGWRAPDDDWKKAA